MIKHDYTLIRSKRKTIAIYVRNGEVEVRAPLKTSKNEIDKFVNSKQEWITKVLAQSNKNAEQRQNFNLDYNDTLTYRGRQYPIVSRNGNHIGFDEENGQFFIPPDLDSKQIKSTCVRIYKMLAKRDLTEKAIKLADRVGVVPTAVKVNSAKTLWGSCSAKRSINFSWRLIMADDDVIDYVVVHELVHIVEMSHSKRFWMLVERVYPDYRKRKLRLKELQKKLNVENWE
jgi:predicted metal-dependent hydrolase